MKTFESGFGFRALFAPALLAAVCFAEPSSAQSGSVTTVYSGEECEAGDWVSFKETTTQDGYFGPKVSATQLVSPVCPIIRTKPTYTRIFVTVFFMDMDAASEENASSQVRCGIGTEDQESNFGSSDANHFGINAKTLNGVFRNSPMDLSYTAVPTANQPFWTDIISTVPKWRRSRLSCDPLPTRTAIRSYLVTESP